MNKNILLIISIILLLCGCKKDKMPTLARVNTNEIYVTPSYETVNVKGDFYYRGRIKSIKVVVVNEETMSNQSTATASISNSSFSADLYNLNEATPYYLYCIYDTGYGTAEGKKTHFVTKEYQKPTVTTNSVTSIGTKYATCGGNVTSDGGADVTARGVCWGTSQYPTISDSHTTNGSGTGYFTSSITGLDANTTYYVRAYATNKKGTSYGEQKTFKTQQGGGSVTPLSEYLGTYSVSAYNWDDKEWVSWSGTTISTFTSSTGTTWVKIEGLTLGANYSFYHAMGEYDETTGAVHLYGDWYFPNKTFYFNSNPNVYYYSVFRPVYTYGNSFSYLADGYGEDEAPEMYLKKNSNGKLTLTGADYSDSNGNVANGFCLNYYKKSDDSYAGRFHIYTNYTMTKTSSGKSEPESLEVNYKADKHPATDNHKNDSNSEELTKSR